MTVNNASSKQDVVHNLMPSLNLRGQLQWQVEKTTKCWLVAMILLRMGVISIIYFCCFPLESGVIYTHK